MRAYVTRIPVAITLLAVLAASTAHAQQADSLPRLRPPRLGNDTLRFTPPAALAYLVPSRVAPATVAREWARAVREALAARQAARLRFALAGGDSTALFGIKPAVSLAAVLAPPVPV